MRKFFFKILHKLFYAHKHLWFITADLGKGYVEDMFKDYPDRCINVGVSEQNMIGIASGLAKSGKFVFVYSIANFLTIRCLEQFRNDIYYHNFPVALVGIGGGAMYSNYGYSHQAIEDVSIMLSFKDLTVICPNHYFELEHIIPKVISINKPCYIRLGSDHHNIYLQQKESLAYGEALLLKTGRSATVLSSSNTLHMTELIRNLDIEIWSVPYIRPLDKRIFFSILRTRRVMTIESCGSGGLSRVISFILMSCNFNVKFIAVYFTNDIISVAGSENFIMCKLGLSNDKIYKSLINLLDID